ncbi:hypothetical protein [Streptacidiphilus jiangxiensis]|uniref:Uncharacterized protein n=1 Tax=Streptacidiphilus jiangxiensis TaxID=235985 RepID=A0A1H7VI97_STRJI|nr:hypothetical protein [Streptacidiphilus jiangxiensis]SEM08923.1 hypothetical protein SAMN05414137_11858 [Streptacidiphilus jiangxiensis]
MSGTVDAGTATGTATATTVDPDAEAQYASSESELFAARGLGLAMALAAADPVNLVHAGAPLEAGIVRIVLLALMALAAWFTAAPVVARPVTGDHRWASALSRHRNTVLAVGFVVAVALGDPPVWMMTCDAGLLLAYLLFVDGAAAGPPGAAQLRDWPAVVAAVAATGLVLAGATVSVATADSWARATAGLLVLAVATGVALTVRRSRG